MKKRLFGALLAITVSGVLSAPAAQAAQPTRSVYTDFATDTITNICPFPIRNDSPATVTELDFTNSSGDPTKIIFHVAEQDVFSAHGTTIPTAIYHYTVRVVFDPDGNLLHVWTTGVVVRMRLPDGTMFNAAGRADVVNSEGPFTISPDVGHSGNVAAFCQALS
jgi:hypothetical protein